ncbi:PP2C family protein-serine/threonine phosphatase [Streptomyces lancefieldiae]|uniref:PP2C family protein-serine/threonine phosphatase n=1 Tax=Streptomyces lancefieldiae TaxID=3075520 RepID=A0ABU3AWV3_9ACTN|nr:PP2C family protein-serine/threonine phosphatase [Streptomyces sp. DSM 40712]MDT0613291.1 PP2C family protein-serine/threonine phosphatase [Streptomyces sp. DSM 40712]
MFGRLVQAAGRGDAVARHELFSVRGHSVAWAFPLLLLVGITVADVTTGAFQIISWTVLVPGVAAAMCGVWSTAVLAVLALVVYVFADTVWQHREETGLPGLVLVVLGGFIAVLAAAVRVGGEQRMLHMRDIADTTRRTVLRQHPAGWGGLDHAAAYLSSDTEARVGGDFYDIQPGPHGTRVLLGDVQGKGLGAVEAAAALLGTFREAAYHESDLATVAERLETRMRRHRELTARLGRSDGDRFATAVLVGFRPDLPDAVDVVDFGHEPPVAAGPGGVRTLPVVGGLPLGMSDLVPGQAVTVCRPALAADETLLLVTDGVTECRDSEGCFYRHADDITRAIAADPSDTAPARLVALVREGTLRHCRGRLSDDTTVFAVRRRGRPGGG